MEIAELPDVFLPYQKKWIADQSPVKFCEKGRRIGLSWADAADSVLSASPSKSDGGMDVWYIGYNKDMAQEYIRDCAAWARHFDVAAEAMQEEILVDENKDILTFVIKFASGFRVTALSSRPSNLRGKQGKIKIDEAAFHDDLGELLKAAMALLIWGGSVWVISTHNGEDNPFNEYIQDIHAGKKDYALHRIEFKEALNQGLYKRICLVTGKTWAEEGEQVWSDDLYSFYGDDSDEELDVIPSSGGGTYLTRASIEGVMKENIPVVRLARKDEFSQYPKHIREAEIKEWCEEHLLPLLLKLDEHINHYFGSDFARINDLSVIWPLAEERTLKLTTPFVVEMRNIPFEQQKQVLFYILDRLPRFIAGAMDARGNGQYLAEVAAQEYGSTRVEQVMLSQEWYRQNMPRFKAHFEDQTTSVPRDADILADLRAVKKDKGVAKVPDNAKVRGSDGKDRHGDAAIALALATFAVAEMEGAPIEYTPAPSKGNRWDGPEDDSPRHRKNNYSSGNRGLGGQGAI